MTKRFAAPLVAAVLAALAAGCSSDGGRAPDRLVLLGLDAADADVIARLRERGELPNFDRLFEEGIVAEIAVEPPIFSPVIWTTQFTGCRPAKHGIESFTLPVGEEGRRVPVTSNLVRRRTLWDILGRAGVEVGVSGHWVTWPAEEVNGFLLSNYTWPPEENYEKEWNPTAAWDSIGRRTWPPGLDEEVMPAVNVGKYFASEHFPNIDRLDPPLRHYLDKDFAFLNAGITLFDKYEPRFFTQYMEEIDFFEHKLWLFHKLYEKEEYGESMEGLAPPARPLPPGVLDRIGPMVARTYILADRLIGLFLERLDLSKDAIVVVSDHGFRTWPPGTKLHVGDDKFEVMPFWHSDRAILVAAGAGFGKGRLEETLAPECVTPIVLAAFGLPVARDMDGAVPEDLFDDDFLKQNPITRIDSYESGGPGAAGDSTAGPIESPADDRIREKLKSLGYLD